MVGNHFEVVKDPSTSPMALGDGLPLDLSVFICFCHFEGSFEDFLNFISLACAPLHLQKLDNHCTL